MQERDHLDLSELDALLRASGPARGVTVESFHLEHCRTCREALLDLALVSGILRGATLRPLPDFMADDYQLDAPGLPAAQEQPARLADRVPLVMLSRMAFVPRHPEDDTLLGLVATARDERVRMPDGFLSQVRHVSGCDRCLTRVLRLGGRAAPSAGRVASILRALGRRSGLGGNGTPDTGQE